MPSLKRILLALLVGLLAFICLLVLFLVAGRIYFSAQHREVKAAYRQTEERLRVSLLRESRINPFGVICDGTFYNLADGVQISSIAGLELDLGKLNDLRHATIEFIDPNAETYLEITSLHKGSRPDENEVRNYHMGLAEIFGGKEGVSISTQPHEFGQVLLSTSSEKTDSGVYAQWASIARDDGILNRISLYKEPSKKELAAAALDLALENSRTLEYAAAYECLESLISQDQQLLREMPEDVEVRELGAGRVLIEPSNGYAFLLLTGSEILPNEYESVGFSMPGGHSARILETRGFVESGDIMTLHGRTGEIIPGEHKELGRKIGSGPFDYVISKLVPDTARNSNLVWGTRKFKNRSIVIVLGYDDLTDAQAEQRVVRLLHSLVPLDFERAPEEQQSP